MPNNILKDWSDTIFKFEIVFHYTSQNSFFKIENFNILDLGCLCVREQQGQVALQGKGNRVLNKTRWPGRDLTDKGTVLQHATKVSRTGLVAVTRSDTVQWLPDKSIVIRKVWGNVSKSVHGSGWGSGSTRYLARQGLDAAQLRQRPSQLKCISQAEGESSCWGFFQLLLKQLFYSQHFQGQTAVYWTWPWAQAAKPTAEVEVHSGPRCYVANPALSISGGLFTGHSIISQWHQVKTSPAGQLRKLRAVGAGWKCGFLCDCTDFQLPETILLLHFFSFNCLQVTNHL